MNIGCVIQARTGSKRLPGKVLMDICGKPVLSRVIERAQKIKGINYIILATTDKKEDDVLQNLAHRVHHIPTYRGPEDDVLARYYGAARAFSLDAIVRITADCPLLDPEVSSRVVEKFMSTPRFDYVSNTIPPTFPDGLDTEVFSFWSLLMAYENASSAYDREHVTSWMYTLPRPVRVANIWNGIDYSNLRWTLDELDDLTYIRYVYKQLGDYPKTCDIMQLEYQRTRERNLDNRQSSVI